MTERLAQLLQAEADALDVPPPAAGQVLTRGRSLRRRRRLVTGGAALAAVVVVAGTAVVLDDAWRGTEGSDRLPGDLVIADPAGAADAFQDQGAFAVGRDLHIGPNRFAWKEAIKAIYYTSAGVVVRSGENDDPDEGGSNYTLVTPTGEPSDIDVGLDDQVPGFEPDSPNFAYTDLTGDGVVEVVVHDVETDRELARVPIAGEYVGGWAAPPAAIDGDVVWVRNVGGDGVIEVDWRTGDSRPVPGTEATYEIANGVYADTRDERWVIRSMADAGLIRELDLRGGWYGFFSPDGRFMRTFPNMGKGHSSTAYEIFDTTTGEMRAIADSEAGDDMGWTPDGHLMRVDGDTVSVCEPLVDDCRTTSYDLGSGTIRIGGEPYGS